METINVASVIETSILGVFIYYLINGLKNQISALKKTITIQNDTLTVMEKRVQETEKVGNIYKDLMSSLPEDLDNYKAIMSKTKDSTITLLQEEQANMQKKLDEAVLNIEKSEQNNKNIKIIQEKINLQNRLIIVQNKGLNMRDKLIKKQQKTIEISKVILKPFIDKINSAKEFQTKNE